MGLSRYRKYGNAAEKIRRAIGQDMVSHAYLIEGDHTIDKIGFTRAFTSALLCREKPGEGCGECVTCRKIADGNLEDMYIVSPEESGRSQTRSIRDEQIEKLQEDLMGVPNGPRNIAVIESADTMTLRAQTRLLKTLEEPQPGTVIMILSENAETLLATIRSRCVKVRLTDLNEKENTKMQAAAEEILGIIAQSGYFFDMKDILDKKVKNRSDAYEFIDAYESVLGRYLRKGGSYFTAERLAGCIREAEKARTALRLNASPKYVLRDLVLRAGDPETFGDLFE